MTLLQEAAPAPARRAGNFHGVAIDDKSLAATLELLYLRPLLA